MKNIDDIKSMDVYEMASFLENVMNKEICNFCSNNNCMYDSCAEGLVKWLLQENDKS